MCQRDYRRQEHRQQLHRLRRAGRLAEVAILLASMSAGRPGRAEAGEML